MKYDHNACAPDDHTRDAGPDGPDAQPRDSRGRMLCSDCHAPLLYCDTVTGYDHVDPDAPPCFLVH
jgi:hypothetical protein